jgi:DtxR family Mn-dependent transcriptional regulator
VPSLASENYLKAIYKLAPTTGTAATGKLAELLSVSPGTVTSMLKSLAEEGWAEYFPYEGVRLTDSGRALALRVLRRHRLVELFLVRTLGLSWDEVHAEAENMEHAVSDLLVDRIDAFLGFPAFDPHGDPIPKADGTIAADAGLPLAELAVGETFRLLRVADQSPEFLRYLSEAGLAIGTTGVVSGKLAAAGTLTLTTPQGSITLATTVAERLYVER